MCTLLLAHRCLPGSPLAVAANRDEFLDRASRPPQLVRSDPRILMPRDEAGGGTWLGLNEHGLFVGVANRAGAPPDKRKRSRGLLVSEALDAPDARSLHSFMTRVDARAYNPFHLVYADDEAAFVTWSDGTAIRQHVLPTGVHIVTERSLGGDDHGRADRLLGLYREKVQGRETTLEGMAALLKVHGPDGDPLAGTCVHADSHGYGTRSGFVYLSGVRRRAAWLEGHPCEAEPASLDGALDELFWRGEEASAS